MTDYDLKYTGAQIDGLLDAANELKTNGYIYKGVATPSTNPGTPTERVAYLASEPGTYTNFGGIVIASGLYSLTYAGGTWTGTQMQAGSDIEVVQTTGDSTTAVMSQKAVTDECAYEAVKCVRKFSMAAAKGLTLNGHGLGLEVGKKYKIAITMSTATTDSLAVRLYQTTSQTAAFIDRKSTRLNSSHVRTSRMPSSA